jgi:hypothetical protein
MQETKEVATVIGYRGKITEFDASSRFAQIDTKEAMYIEYQRMSDNKCSIFYKRMDKMRVNTGLNNPDNPNQRIIPQQ